MTEGGYWVRRDVLAVARFALTRLGPGDFPLDRVVALIRAFAPQIAPTAADATDDDIRAALRILGCLRDDGSVRGREFYA